MDNVHSSVTRQREGRAKGTRSRSPVKRVNSAERQGRECRPPCLNYKRGNCSHNRECDYWHPPHCKYFKNNPCQMRKGMSIHTHPQKKNRFTSPTGKGKGKQSEQEKVTVAIVNVANPCPRTTSEKLLQFETSMNSRLKAEGNLEQIRRSQMPMQGIIALKTKLPSDKRKHQILMSPF